MSAQSMAVWYKIYQQSKIYIFVEKQKMEMEYYFLFFKHDIAILANTLKQDETQLHSLEQAAAGIGLQINAHKTEYMCFNQAGDISTWDGTSLKLVDKFTYLGSSVSSTEKDIDTWLTKTWTAIDSSCVDIALWMHYLDANKTAGEEARWQLHKNVESNIE